MKENVKNVTIAPGLPYFPQIMEFDLLALHSLTIETIFTLVSVVWGFICINFSQT